MYYSSCHTGYNRGGFSILLFLGLFFLIGIFSWGVFPFWLVLLFVIWFIRENQKNNRQFVELPQPQRNFVESNKPHVEAYVPITYVNTQNTVNGKYCYECGNLVGNQKYCDSCGLRLNYDN